MARRIIQIPMPSPLPNGALARQVPGGIANLDLLGVGCDFSSAWILAIAIDDSLPNMATQFHIVATGRVVPLGVTRANFIGTFQLLDGSPLQTAEGFTHHAFRL